MSSNPDRQLVLARDKREAFKSGAPSLTHIKNAYSEELLVEWMAIQLESINNFGIVKEKMDDVRLRELARVISIEYHYLSVDELMLFFYMFKTGAYGELYGAVDPLKIMVALRKFTDYRRAMLHKIDAEIKREELKKTNPNTITKEQMLQLKEKAKTDINAFKKLFEGANLKNEKEVWELWKKDERAAMKLIMK